MAAVVRGWRVLMARGNFKPRSAAQQAAMDKGRAAVKKRARAFKRARLQDLEWMASTGETTVGAAERLGVTLTALDKWLYSHGRTDLWRRLRRNEVARFGITLDQLDLQERARERQGTAQGPSKVA